MFRYFKKMYANCSEREVRDLVAAIKNEKYWSGKPGAKDLVYVVALTRAKIPLAQGFQARATFLGRVVVSKEVSLYCRRGRMLTAVKSGSEYTVQNVITWPAFLRIMRGRSGEVYHLVVAGKFPTFVDIGDLAKILAERPA